MKPILLVSALVVSGLYSCEPGMYVSARRDRFTKIVTRATSVENVSASSLWVSGKPPLNQYIFVSQTGNEPYHFNVLVAFREAYDVPESGHILIRMEGGKIISLPLTHGWHTAKGPLIVSGVLNEDQMNLLASKLISNVRIEPVSINEQPAHHYDPYTPLSLANTTRKGVQGLLEQDVKANKHTVAREMPDEQKLNKK